MDRLIEVNAKSWNEGAESYSKYVHSDIMMKKTLDNPANAFHKTTWEVIRKYMPDLRGKRICVPSSGDNHAFFAFSIMGARVTSCDISENQLRNAERASSGYEWANNIEYVKCDTRYLEGIEDNAYDFVYTSNGVHVWIDDLQSMYKNIYRVLKPDGVYIMYEIHPFQRPFGDNLNVIKPYDMVGPFDDGNEITFGWRVMDIQNAIFDSGLTMKHLEEMYSEKDYDWPMSLSLKDVLNGKKVPREEVDKMYDWRQNPMAALPNWMCIVAKK